MTVVQAHLECFVSILIVHIMNDLQSIDIYFRQPAHHLFVFLHYFVVIEVFAGDRLESRSHLYARTFVTSSIDRVQQTFSQVGTCTEILHLLTDLHRRHTAGNTIIISIIRTHQVVVLILDSGSIDRNLRTETFPVFRSIVEPQYR